MKEKIYSMGSHSISRTENCDNTFSLTINFFELAFEIGTYKLVDVFGFFPLMKAIETDICLPNYDTGNYYVKLRKNSINVGDVYDYNDLADTDGLDFQNTKIYYDSTKKIICIGEVDCNDIVIKVNDNILCATDKNGILRCLYIIFDRFE